MELTRSIVRLFRQFLGYLEILMSCDLVLLAILLFCTEIACSSFVIIGSQLVFSAGTSVWYCSCSEVACPGLCVPDGPLPRLVVLLRCAVTDQSFNKGVQLG